MAGYVARTPNANATWTIIGVNTLIGIYLILLKYNYPMSFMHVISEFGAVPILTINWIQPYRLVTSMFLHSGFIHLALNMFALFIFGPDIEMVLGKTRYLLLYFLSGIIAGLVHAYFIYFFFPYKRLLIAPAIGASGAIYGVMAAFAVIFPFRRIMIFMGFPIIAPALLAIMLMAILQTVYAFFDPFSQVAYAAHVGGFIAGLLMAFTFKPSLRRVHYYI